MIPDFSYTRHGSVWTIVAESDEAKRFADEHFEIPDWMGSRSHFTTDWRAAGDLVERLDQDGFLVEDNDNG